MKSSNLNDKEVPLSPYFKIRKEMEWFENWFDSEYYHKLYNNRDDNEANQFIEKLLNEINLHPKAVVLDLACGKGRHSLFLNKKGFITTGVDLSENSISAANSYKNDTLHFEVGDMRSSFCESKFDAIFNLFTSFGYFDSKEENLKVLNSIETMLKQNGIFVIDFMNASKVIKNLVKQETKAIENISFNLSRSIENGNIIKKIDFNDNGKSFHFEEKVQALVLADFEFLINQTNLKIDTIFGDYNLNEFDEKNSDRLIIVGRKK